MENLQLKLTDEELSEKIGYQISDFEKDINKDDGYFFVFPPRYVFKYKGIVLEAQKSNISTCNGCYFHKNKYENFCKKVKCHKNNDWCNENVIFKKYND